MMSSLNVVYHPDETASLHEEQLMEVDGLDQSTKAENDADQKHEKGFV